MAVRQLRPARRAAPGGAAKPPEAAKQGAGGGGGHPLVGLLEENAKRWRGLRAIEAKASPAFAELPILPPAFTEPPILPLVSIDLDIRQTRSPSAPEGVSLRASAGMLMLVLRGRTEKGVFLYPLGLSPSEKQKVADTLVRLERSYGILSRLLREVRAQNRGVFTALEALRRYGPLFGKDYGIPEPGPATGDVYRDFLDAVYYAVLYRLLLASASADAAVSLEPPASFARTRVRAPIALAPPGAPAGRDARSVEVSVTESAPSISFLDEGGSPILTFKFGNDHKTGRPYLSVPLAALLMHLEREHGLLTKLSEAVEGRAGELERVLEEALPAAEAGALLFA